ncbi:hypothetical protein RSOLAG22IIIB_07958 [Rhizoctonia solani]|uniref:Uncharacterized protein n=1 Tax=Rhizoctonia solani TaxID=456999 RepID=A0A0K6FQR3_9AGAM|nr:hypothetical protein RSOLAG22IIIB_07958 [Rhizoctonia solani]
MPPKRKAADESGPAKKKAAAGPKLKKSKAPNWDDESRFTSEKPTGEWARKSVDRWCLLPPYDTSISEKTWQDYYNERSALDAVNTPGSKQSEVILIEELDQDAWKILRKAATDLAAIVLGSKLDDEERKKQIARTLMGSLYYTEMWGNDEGDGSPRDVEAKTRLYSPFGAGESIDFYYRYHLRARMFSSGERFSSLYAKSRMLIEIDPKNPTACSATKYNANKVLKAAPDAVTVFDRSGGKSKGTTAANIKSFEETLFCTEGWISPLKLVQTLFAAGTVMRYNEADKSGPRAVLEKFHYFDGETNGASLLAQELKSLATLEAKESVDQAAVSVSQRLLLLARHGGASETEQGSSQ